MSKNNLKTNNTLAKVKKQRPFICASNLSICLHSSFNALEDIVAVDAVEGDISKNLKVIRNTVNINKEGIYKVTYKVKNKLNITKQQTITVSVIKCK